ncbi:hypothetical protein ACHQM5_004965 [Ranunculus cassubicifolius]
MAALARTLITKGSPFINLTKGISSILASGGAVRGFVVATEQLERLPSPRIIRFYPGQTTTTSDDIFARYHGPGNYKYWKFGLINYPDDDTPRDEIINFYVRILASVLGSEDEARKRIYSVSTRHFFFFVCKVPMEVAREVENIRGVYVEGLSDSEAERPDYLATGEPFINGEAVPYDPKYHEAMVKHFWRDSSSIKPDKVGKYHRRTKSKIGPKARIMCEPKTRTMLPVQ